MPEDDRKLQEDEERKLAKHESIKDELRERVGERISERTEATAPEGEAKVDGVARELEGRAIDEVAETEAEIERSRRAARLAQVVDYLFYLVYGLIGLTFFLELLGARQSAAFMRFLDAVTAPLLSPFEGLVSDPAVGASRFRLSYLVALVVYILLHLAVKGFLRLLARRRTTV